MNILLSLKKHCIHTAAKKKYERSISRYFKNISQSTSEAIDTIEKEIDILHYFLENADIVKIRSKYPDLSGKRNIDVTLITSQSSDKWQLQYDNQAVPVIWLKSTPVRQKD